MVSPTGASSRRATVTPSFRRRAVPTVGKTRHVHGGRGRRRPPSRGNRNTPSRTSRRPRRPRARRRRSSRRPQGRRESPGGPRHRLPGERDRTSLAFPHASRSRGRRRFCRGDTGSPPPGPGGPTDATCRRGFLNVSWPASSQSSAASSSVVAIVQSSRKWALIGSSPTGNLRVLPRPRRLGARRRRGAARPRSRAPRPGRSGSTSAVGSKGASRRTLARRASIRAAGSSGPGRWGSGRIDGTAGTALVASRPLALNASSCSSSRPSSSSSPRRCRSRLRRRLDTRQGRSRKVELSVVNSQTARGGADGLTSALSSS